ncbi:MAG: hypothetical protein KGJ62_04360 [Armatimonadetes bacterium]|nr:hypothetical protein [Armatimonadota bacterium]MDE2207255.1 hypothetical protein [Armatimonadota bacterium]
MTVDLPADVAAACAPLFELLPITRAMGTLLSGAEQCTDVVRQVIAEPAVAPNPALVAGLWLFVDDLTRSHTVSQGIEGPTGAWWHGIMHRREGDFNNSLYWMARASGHPLLAEQPQLAPAALVTAAGATGAANPPDLVRRQREEWVALFSWCARNRA